MKKLKIFALLLALGNFSQASDNENSFSFSSSPKVSCMKNFYIENINFNDPNWTIAHQKMEVNTSLTTIREFIIPPAGSKLNYILWVEDKDTTFILNYFYNHLPRAHPLGNLNISRDENENVTIQVVEGMGVSVNGAGIGYPAHEIIKQPLTLNSAMSKKLKDSRLSDVMIFYGN